MAQPSARDTVVFLGDYVDRGPESYQVLDLLVTEAGRPNRIFLRGNHEIMMLHAAENPFMRTPTVKSQTSTTAFAWKLPSPMAAG